MGDFEPAQIGGLYEQFARRLTLYARQWLDDEQACDCVQQVFMSLMRNPGDIKDMRAWLFRATRNAALDRLRREDRRRHRETLVAGRRCEWFADNPAAGLEAAEARVALEQLPEDMREVVILRFWGGLSLRQAAEVVERPPTSTARLYYNALVKLKNILGH